MKNDEMKRDKGGDWIFLLLGIISVAIFLIFIWSTYNQESSQHPGISGTYNYRCFFDFSSTKFGYTNLYCSPSKGDIYINMGYMNRVLQNSSLHNGTIVTLSWGWWATTINKLWLYNPPEPAHITLHMNNGAGTPTTGMFHCRLKGENGISTYYPYRCVYKQLPK